jgi:hypothetical protein
MNGCAVKDCGKERFNRNLCVTHYHRWWRHGDPLIMLRRPCGSGSQDRMRGYWTIYRNGRRQWQHIMIAEAAIGRGLPPRAEVHHVDGDGANNSRRNLVICQDHAYHAMLHKRADALRACGNASWRRCWMCNTYDSPQKLSPSRNVHPACEARRKREYRARLRTDLHGATDRPVRRMEVKP